MTQLFVIFFITILSLPIASATVIGPGTICELTHFNVSFNQNYTVDNLYCITTDNNMIFEDNSLYKTNFSITLTSNTTPINMALTTLENDMHVIFTANASTGTTSNISIGIYEPGERVRLYHNGVEDGMSPLTANATGYLNFAWTFASQESFEFTRTATIPRLGSFGGYLYPFIKKTDAPITVLPTMSEDTMDTPDMILWKRILALLNNYYQSFIATIGL